LGLVNDVIRIGTPERVCVHTYGDVQKHVQTYLRTRVFPQKLIV